MEWSAILFSPTQFMLNSNGSGMTDACSVTLDLKELVYLIEFFDHGLVDLVVLESITTIIF